MWRAFVPLVLWGAAAAAPGSWQVDPSVSALQIAVAKQGALGHDHLFRPDRWDAQIRYESGHPENAEVEVDVPAASLHDHEPGISAKDEAEVDATTQGPKVLDAPRFAKIRFTGHGLHVTSREGGTLTGTVDGELTLHGETKPVQLTIELTESERALRAKGSARFRQTTFGIKPYAKFLGAVAVRDEVEVTFTVVAHRP